MFYVPYFVAWETSGINGAWVQADRPGLNAELLTRLTFFNTEPQRIHFIVVGRISQDVSSFLMTEGFENMVKLAIEDSHQGRRKNLFAIPYPTWFRYYPALEPSGPLIELQSSVSVVYANYSLNLPAECRKLEWSEALTSQLRAACNGRSRCSSVFLPAWSMPHEQLNECPVFEISGMYQCGNGPPLTFKMGPGEMKTFHALILSCTQGPHWLLSSSISPALVSGTDVLQPELPLPQNATILASLIGSAESKETGRVRIFQMCQQRPNLCVSFDTGSRTNFSLSVSEHIPDLYQLIMASTFCINPKGDSPTRKGLFDALVLGCIPVIFTEDSLKWYRMHIPSWESISVLVSENMVMQEGFNLFDYLQAYARDDPSGVQQKQRAINNIAYSLQYSSIPAPNNSRGPDAFDLILQHLQALVSNESKTISG